MFNADLSRAIKGFAALVLPLSEKDLEREWIWKDHDEEGIRFAFFVTLQELRHLAVTLSTLRSQPTPAQHILSQYHATYMDLQAAILDLPAETARFLCRRGAGDRRGQYRAGSVRAAGLRPQGDCP